MLDRFTDQVEVYSIDESFLGFDGFPESSVVSRAQDAVKAVKQGLGLPICIGVAPTKTLAKIANHYAKKLQVPGSVLALNTLFSQTNALKNLPVNEIWGIGRRLTEHLAEMGIHTALELSRIADSW